MINDGTLQNSATKSKKEVMIINDITNNILNIFRILKFNKAHAFFLAKCVSFPVTFLLVLLCSVSFLLLLSFNNRRHPPIWQRRLLKHQTTEETLVN